MEEEEDWDTILYNARVAITDHPAFNAWYGQFSEHTQGIIDDLLDHNITPEMISCAGDSPDAEWQRHWFLRALGGGNCDPEVAAELTDIVLEYLFLEFPDL